MAGLQATSHCISFGKSSCTLDQCWAVELLSRFYLGKLKIYEIICGDYMRWFLWLNVSFNLLLVFQHDIYTWGDPEVFVKYMSQLVNPLVSWCRPLDPKSNRTSRIRSRKTTFPGCVFIHSFSTDITSRSQDFCLREFLNCLCKELSIFFTKVRSWGIQYSWWRWVLEFYVPATYLRIEKNIDTFTGRLSVCEEVTDLKYETLLFRDTKP